MATTGPYKILGARDRSLRLVRNPYFMEWSRAARSAGYPDEIRIALVPTTPASYRNEVESVKEGLVDLPADVAPGSHEELRSRSAGQVHEMTLPTTMFRAGTAAFALRKLGYPVAFRYVSDNVYWAAVGRAEGIQLVPGRR